VLQLCVKQNLPTDNINACVEKYTKKISAARLDHCLNIRSHIEAHIDHSTTESSYSCSLCDEMLLH
jgi:hypothetical protein